MLYFISLILPTTDSHNNLSTIDAKNFLMIFSFRKILKDPQSVSQTI